MIPYFSQWAPANPKALKHLALYIDVSDMTDFIGFPYKDENQQISYTGPSKIVANIEFVHSTKGTAKLKDLDVADRKLIFLEMLRWSKELRRENSDVCLRRAPVLFRNLVIRARIKKLFGA